MISPQLDFNLLKQRVTIEQVLAVEGVLATLKRKGSRLVGPCPLHGGDNPRAFVVNLDTNTWYCFTRCGGGGDIVELVRRLGHPGYREAAIYLASLAGASPVGGPHRSRNVPSGSSDFRPFTRRLSLDPHAPILTGKGITPATVSRFESGTYHGRGFLEGCVGVRLHDPEGHPLGYAGRRLDARQASDLGKWKMPPRLPKSRLLYNVHRVGRALPEMLVVVEGPWSVMRLFQLGIPSVALLGLHLSEFQVRLLSEVPKVILMLDGDDAGRSATGHLADVLRPHARVKEVVLPAGLDPDDLSDAGLRDVLGPFFLL